MSPCCTDTFGEVKQQYTKCFESRDVPPIHLAPYRAAPKQQEFEREEVVQMKNASIAELAVAEKTLIILFAPKKCGIHSLRLNYSRPGTVTAWDSYPVP